MDVAVVEVEELVGEGEDLAAVVGDVEDGDAGAVLEGFEEAAPLVVGAGFKAPDGRPVGAALNPLSTHKLRPDTVGTPLEGGTRAQSVGRAYVPDDPGT